MLFKALSSLVVCATCVLALPAVEPTGSKGLVESNKLRRLMLRSELLAKAKKLEGFAYATTERNRLIGTPGHNATITWIHDTIAAFPDYYTVSLQPFDLALGISANLTVNAAPLEVFAVGLSPGGSVGGSLVHIPNLGCEKSDFPADLKGKVVLVFRGTCQSGVKVAYAGAAGAAGAIVYNNVEGNLDGYSLQRLSTPEGPYVPTGGISQADGLALIARLDAGETIDVKLSTVMDVKTTYNVIAETIAGDHDNVIHISGHSDSVAAGPGINDNGSGTISILETAIQLTKFTVNNAVRFSWWSAEEEGLLGATYYVSVQPQSELDKIRLMLDFDMMASPNYAFQIYDGDGSAYGESGPPGSGEAELEFQRFFTQELKQNFTQIEFDGRSDYGPFLAAGVATGGIACGAEGIKTVEEAAMFGGVAGVAYDVNYHAVGDNVKNLNTDAWIQMTKAIAHMTATFARSFELLPPKKSTLTRRAAMSEKATGKTWGV
ncbi:hypothetical protein VTL71DRAFT_14804 [Oculimacula yallundae]|uniref:Peptide hydrolase n=1 Tax=Oculimacula yallundae TaxID=86028 RepID=A0ABR4CK38_9HELO